jgi:hypothetical protein
VLVRMCWWKRDGGWVPKMVMGRREGCLFQKRGSSQFETNSEFYYIEFKMCI